MQTYDVGEYSLVVNDDGMVPVQSVCDTHTDLLMQFGDANLRYDRRMGTISGTGVKLEFSPEYDPLVTVVRLDEPGKRMTDMKVLGVLKPPRQKLH